MDKKNYEKLTKAKTPPSPTLRNCVFAFFTGGAICVLGQLITDGCLNLGVSKEHTAAITSSTLIFLGAFFTAIGVYDKFAKHAGAGSLVPITGFANAVVSPAMEFRSEGLVMGIGAKLFVVSGPVLVYGITASAVYGVILYLIRLVG